jgi:dihydroxy-acid dehydratase
VALDDAEIQRRRASAAPFVPRITSGYLSRYARIVGSGSQGAVTT